MTTIKIANLAKINNTPKSQENASSSNGFSALQWALISLSVALQDKAVVEVKSQRELVKDQIKQNSENAENNYTALSWDQTHKYITVLEFMKDFASGRAISNWSDLLGQIGKDGDSVPTGAEFEQMKATVLADIKNKDFSTANILVNSKVTPEVLQQNATANEEVQKKRSYIDGKAKVDQQLMQVASANNSSTVSSVTQVTDLLSANNSAITKSAEAIARG